MSEHSTVKQCFKLNSPTWLHYTAKNKQFHHIYEIKKVDK